MTRFVHDEFAKDYLEELLKPYGEVKSSESRRTVKTLWGSKIIRKSIRRD